MRRTLCYQPFPELIYSEVFIGSAASAGLGHTPANQKFYEKGEEIEKYTITLKYVMEHAITRNSSNSFYVLRSCKPSSPRLGIIMSMKHKCFYCTFLGHALIVWQSRKEQGKHHAWGLEKVQVGVHLTPLAAEELRGSLELVYKKI